jgi:branched-chain amino acid transport system substrate-binding protein
MHVPSTSPLVHRFAACLAITLMVATACGSGDDAADADDPVGATTEGAPAAPDTTMGERPETDPTSTAAAPTGPATSDSPAPTPPGTEAAAGPATGDPIKLGYVSTGDGPVGLPEVDFGVDAAVRRVNELDGGVAGRPIDLVRCSTDGTPESSLACANQFVEEGVVGVIEGVDIGSDAKIPVLTEAGIATFGAGSVGINQMFNDHSFWFSPPVTNVIPTAIAAVAEIGVGHVGFVTVGDVPQSQSEATAAVVDSASAQFGVDVSTYDYSAAAPDFAPALTAAMADGVEAIVFSGVEAFCTSFVQTARQMSFTGPLVMGVCTDYADVIGADAAGTYNLGYFFGPRSTAAAPTGTQTAIAEYLDDMGATGHADAASAMIPHVFGYVSVIDAVEVLRTVDGDVTSDSVLAAFRAASGVGGSFGQPVTCNPAPHPGFSACGASFLVFEFVADGTQTPFGGGYFDLPAG